MMRICLALLTVVALQTGDRAPLDIRVQDGNWGGAGKRDIRAVLQSAAGELWSHFPDRKLKPIMVSRGNGGPITLYRRGPNGEIRVRLDVNGLYWAQFAFQFAHELCHILCNYDDDQDPNEWFEEMICELASLYTLRKMADTWKDKAPYPNWRGYSKALRKYADDRMKDQALPENTTLARYYAMKEKELRNDKELRKINGIIATDLLPLFEEKPEHWEAVTWLNAEPAGGKKPFRDYLSAWHRHAPKRHRAFITRIAARFGVRL